MASPDSMNWWRDRWSTGQTNWHMDLCNPNLIRHLPYLADGRPIRDAGLLLMPLCGKSLDMKFLYEQGYRVLGVDCSDKAVQDFFVENGLQYQTKTDPRIGTVYATPDARLKVICGDVLKLTVEIVGEHAQMVWDRGGLVAMDKESRKDYATVMTSLVAPAGRYLLDTLHYSDWYYSGPPRNVPPKLIECLFEGGFSIRLLERIDVSQRLQRLGVSPVFEHIHLLTATDRV